MKSRVNKYGETYIKCPVTEKWVNEATDHCIAFGVSKEGLDFLISEEPNIVEEYCEEFEYDPEDGLTKIDWCFEDASHFTEWVVEHYSKIFRRF